MKNLKKLLLPMFIAIIFVGCLPVNILFSDNNELDPALVQEVSSFPMGDTYTQKKMIPDVEKFPVKALGWKGMKKFKPELAKFVHTNGDYLPIEIELVSVPQKTKGGTIGRIFFTKDTFYSAYTVLIVNWTKEKNILLEIPILGECTIIQKELVSEAAAKMSNRDYTYLKTCQDIAENNAIADMVEALEKNRTKIDIYLKEYQKSKNVF